MTGDLCYLFQTFPYLFANLAGVPVVATALLLMPSQRRMTFYSGVTTILMSPVAVLHEQEYWTPLRIGNGPFGIEDILFAFLTGSMSWALSALLFQKRLTVDIQWKQFCQRFIIIACIGSGLLLCFRSLGFDIMSATLAAQWVLVIGICLGRWYLLPLVISGAIFYSFFHILEINLWFRIWPEFVSYWSSSGFWGTRRWGIPLGEWAFTTSFGASVPAFLGYYAEVRIKF